MYLREISLRREIIPNPDQFPFSIPALRGAEAIALQGSVTFFVGENGSGKSTLLEAVAYQCGFATAGGGRNNRYEVDASESALGPYIRLSWLPKITRGFFLRAESFYQFASYLDQLEREGGEVLQFYGGRSLHTQSHGESFLSLFQHRFGQRAIYLLDEPEAALSPARQLAFMRLMHDLAPTAQFVVATHSPILLGYPGAQILHFDDDGITQVAYEATDHYRITRRFLEAREELLRELFREDE